MRSRYALIVIASGALAGCGGGGAGSGAATPGSSDVGPAAPPAPDGTAQAPASTADADCSVKGQWQIALAMDGGCPLPDQIVLEDGAGHSVNQGKVPAMQWTLSSRSGADGSCSYRLEGQAGRLFSVAGEVSGEGASLAGKVQATAGETRFGCGGEAEVSGKRR